MIKKLNHTKFMKIKLFYENEMKENLYHSKKVDLMDQFDSYYMKVICREVAFIKNEVIYLR